MNNESVINISIVGNPNSGKTTLFNGLTGGTQRVGNWAGVTVEKKEGYLKGSDKKINIVDLPGIYSLSATSEDEKVARDYILSGESSLVVDIVDASNIERNLYLLTQLIEMDVPVLVVLNMMDLAERKGIKIDISHLEKHLGCSVVPITALEKNSSEVVSKAIEKYATITEPSKSKIVYPNEITEVLDKWGRRLDKSVHSLGANKNWIGIKLLERDRFVHDSVVNSGDITDQEIETEINSVEKILDDETDIVIADYKYAFINGIVKDTIKKKGKRRPVSKKIDKEWTNGLYNKNYACPDVFSFYFILYNNQCVCM